MQAPRTNHWDAAIRVLRYLKGTIGPLGYPESLPVKLMHHVSIMAA